MADQRALYTEEAVGAGHPTKTDTINRLALVEHENDGTHKTAIQAAAVIADNKLIRGDGGVRGVQEANIEVDDNGIVTMAGQSGCGVKLTSDQTIASGAWVKLALATELWDTRNEFDNVTNYRFTVGVAGKYLVIGNTTFDTLSDGKYNYPRVYKNGTSSNVTSIIAGGAALMNGLSLSGI